jgi:xylan 1,4-beta-xylosidase
MSRLFNLINCFLLLIDLGFGQSPSFNTYMNPVIPGDHPDCTLTRIGNDFYTTGSSFNPTPVIYHSTDLVHWEAIAQPVSAAWTGYGDAPAGGCWGGQVVYHGNKYWDFFCRNWAMYFVTADDIRGPWSMPTAMNTPPSVPGLGYDNSIFIDDDGKWYLLVKNGQVNNWIVQLGNDGQPSGAIYDLTWLNPAPTYPFSWAEGPVMWKYKGHYYYSFARNVAGGQKVFGSDSLTANQASWTNLGDFFNESDPLRPQALFQNPNHSSAAVMLDDSTSWVVHPLWRNANSNEWYGQGRQGLLNQVHYDASDKPTADYPINVPRNAPILPSSGIPWMVPHSDFFDSVKLNPEWSFLGYTPASSYSLTTRNGWLTLSPKGKLNTIIKNDGEHNYSIITKLDFNGQSVNDQAGIWIFNGLQTLSAKLYRSVDSLGVKIVAFSYDTISYQMEEPVPSEETILLLKLVRVNHMLSGYCSANGSDWFQIGSEIDVSNMENLQANYNSWTGNRQGLFVQGRSADFDFYIYRDAYTPILAECPANQYGTTISAKVNGISSLNVHNSDWTLYAGVEFGNSEYAMAPDSLKVIASCGSDGGTVEAWLDSLDTGTFIGAFDITSTGGWDTYSTFGNKLMSTISGNHDLYLRFWGVGTSTAFMLRSLVFTGVYSGTSVHESSSGQIPESFNIEQNYPNPFNPTTAISYRLSTNSFVTLRVYDVLGREVATLVNGIKDAGFYSATFDGSGFSSGIYLTRIVAQPQNGGEPFVQAKKMLMIK